METGRASQPLKIYLNEFCLAQLLLLLLLLSLLLLFILNGKNVYFPPPPLFFFYFRHSLQEQSSSHASEAQTAGDKKKPHIKKPLNAFMLFMKEMRPKVVAECTLKESAAINQILGRKVSTFSCFLFNGNMYHFWIGLHLYFQN